MVPGTQKVFKSMAECVRPPPPSSPARPALAAGTGPRPAGTRPVVCGGRWALGRLTRQLRAPTEGVCGPSQGPDFPTEAGAKPHPRRDLKPRDTGPAGRPSAGAAGAGCASGYPAVGPTQLSPGCTASSKQLHRLRLPTQHGSPVPAPRPPCGFSQALYPKNTAFLAPEGSPRPATPHLL